MNKRTLMIAVGLLALSSTSLFAQKRRLTDEELAARAAARAQYPTSQRIQLSESCPSVAKWLTQGFAPGAHWQMLSYEPELGTLSFNVLGMADLSKANTRQYVDGKPKQVHIVGVIFTLRSLVTSTLSSGDQTSSGDSCTIASAFKLMGKDGVAFSNGGMEAMLLDTLQKRYAEHGFDY